MDTLKVGSLHKLVASAKTSLSFNALQQLKIVQASLLACVE